jgi:hypothetical protein
LYRQLDQLGIKMLKQAPCEPHPVLEALDAQGCNWVFLELGP